MKKSTFVIFHQQFNKKRNDILEMQLLLPSPDNRSEKERIC